MNATASSFSRHTPKSAPLYQYLLVPVPTSGQVSYTESPILTFRSCAPTRYLDLGRQIFFAEPPSSPSFPTAPGRRTPSQPGHIVSIILPFTPRIYSCIYPLRLAFLPFSHPLRTFMLHSRAHLVHSLFHLSLTTGLCMSASAKRLDGLVSDGAT